MLKLFFTSEQPKRCTLWSCQRVCDALHYLLEKMLIRFCSELYRQTVGISMVTNCAHLLQIWFCLVMRETSCCLLANVIEAFNFTSSCLDYLLNIDNLF